MVSTPLSSQNFKPSCIILKSKDNVQLYPYPLKSSNYSKVLLDDYYLLKELRDDVLKALEEARKKDLIGSSQEANVFISIKNNRLSEIVEDFDEDEFERLFIVSKVIVQEDVEGLDLNVSNVLIKKHDGIRCDRCWNYKNNDEISDVEGAHLCPRCQKAMKK